MLVVAHLLPVYRYHVPRPYPAEDVDKHINKQTPNLQTCFHTQHMLANFKTSATIVAEPLTPDSFAEFGGVISSPHQLSTVKTSSANYGTATKLFQVSPIQSGHPKNQANWNMFRCSSPVHLINDHREEDGGLTYPCKVLERHPYSSQTFLPMGRNKDDTSYMVIVAPSDPDTEQKLPIISKTRAFICQGNQAVTYGMGVWHAPMIALEETTDFGVLIHETGVPELDCEEVSIDTLDIEFTIGNDADNVDEKSSKRKPQTEEEFQKEFDEFRKDGPPYVSHDANTGDTNYDLKQIKYSIEREYYKKNWSKVVELVDSNPTDHKVGAELQEIKRRAEENLKASS